MLELLDQVQEKIEFEWRYISQSINHKENIFQSSLFEECVEIHMDPAKDINGKKLWGKKGIYVFLLDEPIVMTDIEAETYNKLKGAKIKGNRGFDASESECLYTGSVISESLYSRLRQHFGPDSKVGCLHLAAPERSLLLGKVTAYAFPIRKKYIPYIKIIMPALEAKLHEDYMPLAGSSRT